ncbi:MAG: MerR family transcriptional regulator [Limisphaerales bacterium]
MAYTVKQVAGLSGVSVRTLHFYDESGLLKPAYVGPNGYRFYEKPQLLMLQQILFYRELGFELKTIKKILRRKDFEKVAALESHRKVLQKDLTRTRRLIETIDKTIKHLKGTVKMKNEELFTGFSVAAGKDRFGEKIKLGEGYPVDCKVSGKTRAGRCVFLNSRRAGRGTCTETRMNGCMWWMGNGASRWGRSSFAWAQGSQFLFLGIFRMDGGR